MILVNGAVADSVAVTDRGFAYGDGVFRTLLVKQRKPQCWGRQYRKLAHDCAGLALPCPAQALLAEEIARVSRDHGDCVVKIVVTRGSGERGYAPLPSPTPTRVVMTSALPRYPDEFARSGVAVHLCRTRLAAQPRLAGIKHLNRLENVLARAEWNDPTLPEGLMLDEEGNAIGGTMTNLFIAEGEGLATPDLSRCGVAGVARERVQAAAQRHGVACRVEHLGLERVLAAQELLLVNSVVGAWPVKALGGRHWQRGAYAACVQQWLDEDDD